METPETIISLQKRFAMSYTEKSTMPGWLRALLTYRYYESCGPHLLRIPSSLTVRIYDFVPCLSLFQRRRNRVIVHVITGKNGRIVVRNVLTVKPVSLIGDPSGADHFHTGIAVPVIGEFRKSVFSSGNFIQMVVFNLIHFIHRVHPYAFSAGFRRNASPFLISIRKSLKKSSRHPPIRKMPQWVSVSSLRFRPSGSGTFSDKRRSGQCRAVRCTCRGSGH